MNHFPISQLKTPLYGKKFAFLITRSQVAEYGLKLRFSVEKIFRKPGLGNSELYTVPNLIFSPKINNVEMRILPARKSTSTSDSDGGKLRNFL